MASQPEPCTSIKTLRDIGLIYKTRIVCKQTFFGEAGPGVFDDNSLSFIRKYCNTYGMDRDMVTLQQNKVMMALYGRDTDLAHSSVNRSRTQLQIEFPHDNWMRHMAGRVTDPNSYGATAKMITETMKNRLIREEIELNYNEEFLKAEQLVYHAEINGPIMNGIFGGRIPERPVTSSMIPKIMCIGRLYMMNRGLYPSYQVSESVINGMSSEETAKWTAFIEACNSPSLDAVTAQISIVKAALPNQANKITEGGLETLTNVVDGIGLTNTDEYKETIIENRKALRKDIKRLSALKLQAKTNPQKAYVQQVIVHNP